MKNFLKQHWIELVRIINETFCFRMKANTVIVYSLRINNVIIRGHINNLNGGITKNRTKKKHFY